MKSLRETSAVNVNVEETEDDQYPETNWMKASEAVGYILQAKRANQADTKFGTKYFLRCEIEGDPQHTEFTISFNEISKAFKQLQAIEEEEGATAYPFRFIVESVGKTYRLADPPESVPEPQPDRAGRPALPPKPAPQKKAPRQDDIPF